MSENRDAVLSTEIRSATHELRNVLAIVKELAGLIEDLAHAADPGQALSPEKVLRALGLARSGEPARVGPGALPEIEWPDPVRVDLPESEPTAPLVDSAKRSS